MGPRLRAASLALAAALAALGPGACRSADPAGLEPHYRARQRELDYVGPGREDPAPTDREEVLLGWFGPSDPRHPSAGGAWVAAELAVEEANREGGCRGLPFRLLPAWSENPWGTGVRDLARLAWSDGVWAVVGSPDGPSAHLVEQVIAKARLPFVNPISTDSSTNLAGVPWIFSCAPPDHLFAPLLAGELVARSEGSGLAVVSCTDHDSRAATRELLAALGRAGSQPAIHLQFRPEALDSASHTRSLVEMGIGAVAVIAGPQDSAELVRALRREGLEAPVVGGAALARRPFARLAGPAAEGVLLPLLWDPAAGGARAEDFRRRFRERAGVDPDYAEAHTFDAVDLLIAAVRRAGLNRARIRDAIRELAPWEGVTGTIAWDPTGQNARPVRLGTIQEGAVRRLR